MTIAITVGLAQSAAPKYSNEFLFLGAGARSFGLGGAGASIANDVTSGYWNPAGLLEIESDHQGMLMHSAYFGGIANYDYGAFSTSVADSNRIAFSVLRFGVDDIPDTRLLVDVNGAIDYSRVKFFSAVDYAFLVSYAQKLSILSGIHFGGSLKVIHRQVGVFSDAWGFGADLGVVKFLGKTKLAVSARDVFGTFNTWKHNPDELREVYTSTGNEIPVNTTEITLPRVIPGVSRQFKLPLDFSVLGALELGITFDGQRNVLLSASRVSFDPLASLEIGFRDLAYLRLGASQFQQTTKYSGDKIWKYQPSGGVGFKVREITIDYAMTDFADRAEGLYSHVFSIKIDFNAK